MKHIDTDRLKTEIERIIESDHPIECNLMEKHAYNRALSDAINLIDSLQQEQSEGGCSEKPNNLLFEWTEEDERTRWNLCSLLTNLRVGKKIEESTFKKYYSWLKIIHIKPRKPRKSKQPEVDLEKEMDNYYDSPQWEGEDVSWMTYARIARHFADWGAEHLKR